MTVWVLSFNLPDQIEAQAVYATLESAKADAQRVITHGVPWIDNGRPFFTEAERAQLDELIWKQDGSAWELRNGDRYTLIMLDEFEVR